MKYGSLIRKLNISGENPKGGGGVGDGVYISFSEVRTLFHNKPYFIFRLTNLISFSD